MKILLGVFSILTVLGCSSVPMERENDCSQTCLIQNKKLKEASTNSCVCETPEKLEKISIPQLKIRE